jgi:hypothetical protein
MTHTNFCSRLSCNYLKSVGAKNVSDKTFREDWLHPLSVLLRKDVRFWRQIKKCSEMAAWILMLCILFLTCLKYVTRLSLGLRDSIWSDIFCFLSEAFSGPEKSSTVSMGLIAWRNVTGLSSLRNDERTIDDTDGNPIACTWENWQDHSERWKQ